jgi:2,4-dienoyl-CoA reductase-like NADH-dependent reductase (Old Yellow Enzyme family)
VFLHGLWEAGVDMVHVSCRNCLDPGFPDVDPTKSLAEWSKELCPELVVIAVGKVTVTLNMMDFFSDKSNETLTDPEPCLQLLERPENSADLLAIGRALLANPDWVQIVRDKHWSQLKLYNRTQMSELN